MNSKCLIDDKRIIPVYSVQAKGSSAPPVLCVPKGDFELLDRERRRLRQALIDRGIDPDDIPPVEK